MDRIKFFYIHVGFNAFFMYKSNCFEIVFKNVIRVIFIFDSLLRVILY